jgi:hypothetical protein
MMAFRSDDFVGQALTGYIQVQSERGRLTYLPLSLYQTLGYDQIHRFSLFQSRRVRPQHIHIARVAPEVSDCKGLKRARTVSILVEKFGKLAIPRESVQKFLKSIISQDASQRPAINPAPPEPDVPSITTTRRERPNSWAPGVAQERLGRRQTAGLWAEAKRRSFLSKETADIPAEATMRANLRHSIAAPVGAATAVASPHARPSLSETTTRDSMSTISNGTLTPTTTHSSTKSRLPVERPIASGNGVSVSIAMAEPFLFLQGFDQGDMTSNRSTAMLRGSLILKVSKAAKVKAVTLRFRGRATTKWPEGIPPKKTEFEETNSHINHTWPFFNAQFPTAETGTGADHVHLATTSTDLASRNRSSLDILSRSPASNSNTNLSTRELKKLSLQVNQSRSFGKGESPTGGPTVAQKGYRTFQPGDYVYSFELPLDSHLPETIDVDLGSVKYELEAVVERAGAFKTNLVGTKEVVVIRTPAEGSLEQVEPIAISRNWEDQLHYDIVISGKSFPLGAQVPIAFKLTPLAKVQCHRIKVFVTESVEYWCNNKRVHRMEPTRKVQLFEKRADAPPNSTFPGSTMRILSGGGVPYDHRAAAARGEDVPGTDSSNLLGNLDGSPNVGPTEIEFSVQLPSCIHMKDKDKNSKLHFDTTYSNIQVHHWIKIVMRLSKPDVNDPTKRRHFEISIDSPFHILSCRATQANISLPAYSFPQCADAAAQLFECGCPGAAPRRTTPTSYVPALNSLNQSRSVPEASSLGGPVSRTDSLGLARPQAAHIGGPAESILQRPMHIIRAPSFNPPAFEDEEPPPPLETPPPQYDTIASPTSGLADYFARLADAYDESPTDDEEDGQRTPTGSSRVEVPLTPGSTRSPRSMDEVRTWPTFGPVSMNLPSAPRMMQAQSNA